MGCGSSKSTIYPAEKKQQPRSSTQKPVLTKLQDSIGTTTAKKYDFDEDLQRYSKPLAIFAELHERPNTGGLAPVRLLRSSWLLERAEQAERCRTGAERARFALPRRQEMELRHPEAFYSASEVATMAMEPARSRAAALRHTAQLKIVSVSHCWELPTHPDPECRTLIALAKAIRIAQTQRQVTATGSSMRPLPLELAVFFDWCSLFQHDPEGGARRSEEEDLAFRAALSRMQIWYAHQGTTAIFLSALRKDKSVTRRTLQYHERGWPTFEFQVAMLAKPGSSAMRWPSLIDTALTNEATGHGGLAERRAPLTPERMQAHLKTRRFTNGSDHAMVATLYRDTAQAVIGHATWLSYHGSRWDDEQLSRFAEWLPRCHDLRSLHLGANEFGDAGVQALATALCTDAVGPSDDGGGGGGDGGGGASASASAASAAAAAAAAAGTRAANKGRPKRRAAHRVHRAPLV